MGLKGFVQKDYYSKISNIFIDTDREEVVFVLKTLDVPGGVEVVPPMNFRVSKELAEAEYEQANPPAPLLPPEYPAVCLERDSHVPMWTEEDDQNKHNEYENALITYNEALTTYTAAVEAAKENIKQLAKLNNIYEKFFSKNKMFKNSNPVACAYNYLKNLPSFTGVNDDV